MTRHLTQKTAKLLGYEMDAVPYTAKTAITIERDRKLQQGRYLIGMTCHLAAMVDGKLVDWTTGRRKQINGAFTLTKISEPVMAERKAVPFHRMAQTNTQQGLF